MAASCIALTSVLRPIFTALQAIGYAYRNYSDLKAALKQAKIAENVQEASAATSPEIDPAVAKELCHDLETKFSAALKAYRLSIERAFDSCKVVEKSPLIRHVDIANIRNLRVDNINIRCVVNCFEVMLNEFPATNFNAPGKLGLRVIEHYEQNQKLDVDVDVDVDVDFDLVQYFEIV